MVDKVDGFVGQLALPTIHTMQHFSETFRVPFVVFNVAPTDFWDDFQSQYLISVKPSIIPVLKDVVAYHNWTEYAYIFDSEEGMWDNVKIFILQSTILCTASIFSSITLT